MLHPQLWSYRLELNPGRQIILPFRLSIMLVTHQEMPEPWLNHEYLNVEPYWHEKHLQTWMTYSQQSYQFLQSFLCIAFGLRASSIDPF